MEVKGNKHAAEYLKGTLELQLREPVSDPVFFYHLALDIHQTGLDAGFIVKRSIEEIYMKPYEAFSFAVFEEQCEVTLLLPGQEDRKLPRPPVFKIGGEDHYKMPILQLAIMKSYGRAQSRFSSCGAPRWVDLRNGESVARSYRELGRTEDVGEQQVWQAGDKRYILQDGYRSYYMQLPKDLDITLAEFCAWYDRSEENATTMELLRENQGFIGPDKRNEHERILLGEDERRARDAFLPQKILLKNNTTTFSKRRNPVPLEWESLGLEEEYKEKALFSPWKLEEEIPLKEPKIHLTEIYHYYFDGELIIGDLQFIDCEDWDEWNDDDSGDDDDNNDNDDGDDAGDS